jgi:CshA-type fibril repeat protein
VDVLANDSGVSAALDPASVVLRDPSGGWVTSLAVAGEGTWSVDPATGTVTFRPEAGFLVDPTPIGYRVTDANGLSATATVTVDYVPAAADDADLGHAIGDVVVVDALGNDTGDLVPGSTRLVTSAGDRVTELVVPGEGTWTVDARIGAVTFAPEEGFVVDPSPVTYEVTDSTGDTVAAVITVGYVPDAADDASRGNVVGDTVPVDVLANDAGDMDPASVRLLGPDGAPVTELAVPGEGTWAVDARTGVVTFTPEAGFERNPAPVSYQVTDSTGDTVAAQVLVTYRPVATDDVRTGRAPGQPVTVEVVGNDTGDLDPASVRLVGPSGDRVTLLRVAGEGVWTVDPETGHITFTPQDGYDGNPTPVTYEVASTAGDVAVARVVVTYLPQAADDADEGNARGTAVTVDVVGNDRGSLDPTSVRLVGPGGDLVTTLTVAGQGVWSVDPRTGAITFTPEAGFTGDPDPVRYRVLDVEGNPTTAQVRITYRAADPAPAGLAVTGAGAAGAAGGAALLLLLGAALVAWRRRGARA